MADRESGLSSEYLRSLGIMFRGGAGVTTVKSLLSDGDGNRQRFTNRAYRTPSDLKIVAHQRETLVIAGRGCSHRQPSLTPRGYFSPILDVCWVGTNSANPPPAFSGGMA
jgi:hypothetical protein